MIIPTVDINEVRAEEISSDEFEVNEVTRNGKTAL